MPGPTCQVCRHPKLRDIEEELLQGASQRGTARKYGLDPTAMRRHWHNCMPAKLGAAMHDGPTDDGVRRLDAIEGSVLLGQAAAVYERALGLLDRLERGEVDPRATVAAFREVRQSLDLVAKLAFAVEDRAATKVDTSEAPALDAAIMQALAARGVSVDEQPVEHERPFAAPMALPAAST